MATIYRFIVEQKGSGGSGNGGASKKSTTKTITPLKLLGGDGVNHNRAMRGVNAVMNTVIPDYEKGVRLTKSVLGMVKLKKDENGKYAYAGLSWSAIAVLFVLMLRISMSHHKKLIEKQERNNDANYKKLENGQTAIHTQFSVTSHFWSGKLTFNENK